MSPLSDVVQQIQRVLISLEQVMLAEQQQLCAGQIDGSALQRVTEDKSSLLATLDYLESLRQAALKNTPDLPAETLSLWQAVQQQTEKLSRLNQHNGWLLESQREHTDRALAILKPHQAPQFYGADGQAKETSRHTNKKIAC